MHSSRCSGLFNYLKISIQSPYNGLEFHLTGRFICLPIVILTCLESLKECIHPETGNLNGHTPIFHQPYVPIPFVYFPNLNPKKPGSYFLRMRMQYECWCHKFATKFALSLVVLNSLVNIAAEEGLWRQIHIKFASHSQEVWTWLNDETCNKIFLKLKCLLTGSSSSSCFFAFFLDFLIFSGLSVKCSGKMTQQWY